MLRYSLLIFSLLAACPALAGRLGPLHAGASVRAAATTTARAAIVPGRVLVRYRSDGAIARVRGLAGTTARATRALAERLHVLQLDATDEATTLAAIDELRRDPDVEWAEPDVLRPAQSLPSTPNDPLYAQQWALAAVHASEAWSLTHADQVTVAVLDSGYGMHPDLPQKGDPRYVAGYDFVTCRGLRDAVTCPDNPGCANTGDCDGPDPDPTDPQYPGERHGQHVAGIIGAITGNDVGVAGAAWSVKLQPVRVLAFSRQLGEQVGSDSDIAAALEWLAGKTSDGVPPPPRRPDVVNMSLGSNRALSDGVTCPTGAALQAAIDDATAAGIIVVVPAGNSGVDVSTGPPCPTIPAALRNVIVVGAVGPTDAGLVRADYSNYGRKVTIMAPGGNANNEVLSTVSAPDGDQYGYLMGTSQATPFVAATVALMRAIDPNLTTDDARRILQSSADTRFTCDMPAGCGAGLLDIGRAVDQALGARSVQGNVVVGGCAFAGAHASSASSSVFALIVFVGLSLLRKVEHPRGAVRKKRPR